MPDGLVKKQELEQILLNGNNVCMVGVYMGLLYWEYRVSDLLHA